jgi:hypothetical protein
MLWSATVILKSTNSISSLPSHLPPLRAARRMRVNIQGGARLGMHEELMGEKLKGSKIIYHRKPSPNYLGVTKELDADAWRKHRRLKMSVIMERTVCSVCLTF